MEAQDKDILIKMNVKAEMAYNRIKAKMKTAGLYKPEYEHVIMLLGCAINDYNNAENITQKIKLTVNINSLSQQLFLTPKSAGAVASRKEDNDPLADIVQLKKVN